MTKFCSSTFFCAFSIWLRQDLRLHGLVVRHLEPGHDVLDPVAGEQAHELVLAGQVEARLAGVALSAGAAAELVVDPARLVPLGADDVEAAELEHALAELDVDAAAGHVRRDRDGAELAGVHDDLGLALVLLRVQDVVRDAAPLEHLREELRGLDVDRPDEHRLALGVPLGDVVESSLELRLLRAEDQVVLVRARDLDVGRDLDDVQVVDLGELLLLRLGRAGHAGELLVEAEVVLQRDRRQRDVLLLDLHALLGLDRLVQALAPAAALHDAAGELVDDLHLAVLDDVVDVAVEERLRLQPLAQVVDELDVARVVEVLDAQRALDRVDAARERRDRLELLVERVVDVGLLVLVDLRRRLVRDALHALDDAREVVVRLGRRLRLAGDDQRRPRLVDEDRVDLVHDRVGVPALDDAVHRDGHVVAQVVEPELGVRAVGDAALVGGPARLERHHVLDVAHGRAQALVHAAVPLGVALGQVVVDRDQVDVLARHRVQVQRQAGDEGLALAGLHLRDVALVEDDAAHQLDIEDALPRLALAGLADGCEGLEEHVFERLAVLVPLAELGGLAAELVIGERLEPGLERGDVGGLVPEGLEPASFAGAENLFECAVILRHGYRVPPPCLAAPPRNVTFC